MIAQRRSALVAYVKAETEFLNEDLFVIDVGCSAGLAEELRQYEPHLAGVGFDPLVAEIERLERVESNSKVTYVAAWVEPVSGPVVAQPGVSGWRGRSSSTAALALKRAPAK